MSIVGLRSREPVGVVLSLGIKDDRGVPVEKDRFHLVQPKENNGRRTPHPAFSRWTEAKDENVRRFMRGTLVHATRARCFEVELKAQVLPGRKAHPDKRPVCVGDGKKASRWTGEKPDSFQEIVCPNEACPYRQKDEKGATACKPESRLLFRLRWPDGNPLPAMLAKYVSHAWNTAANLQGFFDHIEEQADHLGLPERARSLVGFPFMLTATIQTKASTKSAFPVVTISPEADPMEFFAGQQKKAAELLDPINVVSLQDPEEASVETRAADTASVSVGGVHR